MPSGTHFQIQRIDSLTSIRGVAALVVLFLHVAQTFNFELTFFNLFKNGWLGVDLFFVLSGFILAHVYHQSEPTQKTFISFYKQFIINRLARIYPLHLCTLLFTLGLVIFLPGFYERYPKYFSDISFISNLLLIQNWGFIDISWNTVSWSISAEFFMYLLFPFFLISRSIFNKVEYTVIIILVLLLAHYLIIFSFGWSNYGGMSIGGMVRVFFEFLIGFHIYFLSKRISYSL
ncbi:acyltransferase [Glaciecola sp. KUL10]|uniref:acyltransferase family protein n=1 Tax=Glaciecola sp. (strain KUL10) TaxID=2161813 RepID=UPI00131479EB